MDQVVNAWQRDGSLVKESPGSFFFVTYDEVGKQNAKQSPVNTQNPTAVLALNDPLGNRHDVFPLLGTVGVSVCHPVFARDFVREATGDQGKVATRVRETSTEE